MTKLLKLIAAAAVVIIISVVFYNAVLRYTFVPVHSQGVEVCDRWTGNCERY
jgi:hypothetical protein